MTSPHGETRQRVFLVEDEPALARALSDMLAGNGYDVESCADGREALNSANDRSYDLIVLDVMLPSLDGFEVAARLRRSGTDTPILMLTARDELSDKVMGLKSGADDYLTKPFEAAELLARIEALLRRASRDLGSDLRNHDFGGMRVDFARRRIIRDGETVDLSDQESSLLRYLIENRGQVVSRDTLLKEVWVIAPFRSRVPSMSISPGYGRKSKRTPNLPDSSLRCTERVIGSRGRKLERRTANLRLAACQGLLIGSSR